MYKVYLQYLDRPWQYGWLINRLTWKQCNNAESHIGEQLLFECRIYSN